MKTDSDNNPCLTNPDVLVSLVIPVYKRADWLSKNLEALVAQNYGEKFEVIVVDDGSPNGEEIRRVIDGIAANSELHLLFLQKENGGPAAARNFGVTKSRGELICFLDDDSIPDPNWLTKIVEPFNDHPNVGLVSGQTKSYYQDERLPLLLERVIYSGKCWATCNIAYKREAFEQVGGFDESFPEPSWEDNDLGLRVRWAGFSHGYAEDAVVLHPHERSLEEYRQKCLLNGRGMAVFCKKHWRKRPLWGVGGALFMLRRLVWILHPSVWLGQVESHAFLRFTWSWYSLKGFCKVFFA